MIKAIETYYKGYRFRSRLEARWAVCWDAAGIEYQYENEGFQIKIHEGTEYEESIYYLPDFYLPRWDIYVEIKGSDRALAKDSRKIAFAVDFNATPCSNGLLILGDIPDPDKIRRGNIPLFSYLYCHKGIHHELATFTYFYGCKPVFLNSSMILGYRLSSDDEHDFSDAYGDLIVPRKTSTRCRWVKDYLSCNTTGLAEAYEKARQARFEHGETPII